MNCILYTRPSPDQGVQNDILDNTLVDVMTLYAKNKGWTIVGYVTDEYESVDHTDKAKLKNLRRYLQSHNFVGVVIVAISRPLSIADFAALELILSKKRTTLVVIQLTAATLTDIHSLRLLRAPTKEQVEK